MVVCLFFFKILFMFLCFKCRNKDRAGKKCSAIHVEAQRVHANFESDHHDYTVPKFLREESVRDGRSQTDLEPHPYIYVISS